MSPTPRMSRAGPGLAKAGPGALVRRRCLQLLAVEDGPGRNIVDGADIISEGLARTETSGPVYYGSTSLLLLARSRGGAIDDADIESMAVLLASDPHVRLRALRIAVREARSRAHAEIGSVSAEIEVSPTSAGVVITVDVVAVIHEQAAGHASR